MACATYSDGAMWHLQRSYVLHMRAKTMAKAATAPRSNVPPTRIISDAFNMATRGGDQVEKARGVMAYGVTLLIGELAEVGKCDTLHKLAVTGKDPKIVKDTSTAVLTLLRDAMNIDKATASIKSNDPDKYTELFAKNVMLQRAYQLARAIQALNDKHASHKERIEFSQEAQAWMVPLRHIASVTIVKYEDGVAMPLPGPAQACLHMVKQVRRADWWLPLRGENEAPQAVSFTYDTIIKAATKLDAVRSKSAEQRSNDAKQKAMAEALNGVTELTGPLPQLKGDGTEEGTPAHALCVYMVNHYRKGIMMALERAPKDAPASATAQPPAPATSKPATPTKAQVQAQAAVRPRTKRMG